MGEDDEVLNTRLDPGVKTWMRAGAIDNFQRTGNQVGTVSMAIEAAQAASRAQKASAAPRTGTNKRLDVNIALHRSKLERLAERALR